MERLSNEWLHLGTWIKLQLFKKVFLLIFKQKIVKTSSFQRKDTQNVKVENATKQKGTKIIIPKYETNKKYQKVNKVSR